MQIQRLISICVVAAMPLLSQSGAGITKITPVIYNNDQVKAFLADYLVLTEAQMVASDLAFAEARVKLFPLSERLKQTQTALDLALSSGSPAAQWRPLVNTISTVQAQMMAIECATIERFRLILDGDQRHKLGRINDLAKPAIQSALPASTEVEQ
jgi:molybdenum cofactor biosynthesis enzyme MoaA